MSSIIFHTEESQVVVATDTLVTTMDGEPVMFTTKAFVLPHLQMIIAGTGFAGFLGKWFIEINDRMLVTGIDHLDYHAPEKLAELWNSFKIKQNIPDNWTTTVYHFGFSEQKGIIHNYAYRSSNNFKSEQILQYGIYVKPECSIPENYELPKDFKIMMAEQRTIQSSLPQEQRTYIGGKIQVHHLMQQGYAVFSLDKFEDYDENLNAMFENFNSK
ncbi:MAG: hypothetical protein KJ063_25190 [Anaerolineae bacterium]|nr:hypothetical protein [Anaerolineae bacterium]